jgi:aspartyl-tRNA(Asn)/glutamyl-tRNA(Gln) amidotransferase subunit C
MSLTLEEVRHVATLARLSLSAEEEELMRTQLSAILEAMTELSRLDTAEVEPTSHAAGEVPPWRPDKVQPCFPPEKALGNAPAKVGTSFAVPKILD